MEDKLYLSNKYSAYEIVMIVHELHLRGFEQLRLLCGMSPSGMSWRWMIYPKLLMGEEKRCERDDSVPFRCLRGTTGEAHPENRPLLTADDMLKGNESYFNLALGKDPEYVAWFAPFSEHAKNDDFPIGFADFFMEDKWVYSMSNEKIPFPPFSPVSLNDVPDEQVIEYAQYTFDDDSVYELNIVLEYEGKKPSVSKIADVIRQAVRENKGLINHTDSWGNDEDEIELFAWGG